MIETPTPVETPIEKVTPLRMSEAMRLGSLSYQQAFHSTYDERNKSVCAIGAALVGFGWNPDKNDGSAVVANIALNKAIADDQILQCPIGCVRATSLSQAPRMSPGSMSVHLNDGHRWPIPKIADYLEGLGL